MFILYDDDDDDVGNVKDNHTHTHTDFNSKRMEWRKKMLQSSMMIHMMNEYFFFVTRKFPGNYSRL